MNTVHDATIALLSNEYPKMKTSKVRRHLRALRMVNERYNSLCYEGDLLTYSRPPDADVYEAGPVNWPADRVFGDSPTMRVIPDGFFFDFRHQMLVCFEVEDHHKMTIDKLSNYWDSWLDDLDQYGWGLALIAVDRWGDRKPVPLHDYVFPDKSWISDGSMLAGHIHCSRLEFEYTKLACANPKEWRQEAFDEVMAPVRVNLRTPVEFWRGGVAENVFETLLSESNGAGAKLAQQYIKEWENAYSTAA